MTDAGGQGYSYDLNGNMDSGANRTISWNSENRPVSVIVNLAVLSSYLYNGTGAQVKQQTPQGTTYYFGRFAEKVDVGGTLKLIKYYYAGDLLIAKQDESGKYWFFRDQVDSVRVVTDAAGNLYSSYDYTPFGEASVTCGSLYPNCTNQPNAQQFGGHLQDGTGLLYMKARYYDPKLGRFLSADSIAPSLAQPQELNRYTYVLNNPVQYTDPSGHIACWPNGGCYATPDDPEWQDDWKYELIGTVTFPDGTTVNSYYFPDCDCSSVGDLLIDGRVSLSYSFDWVPTPEDTPDSQAESEEQTWQQSLIGAVEGLLGTPYDSPDDFPKSADCSGLIINGLAAAGFSMRDRTAAELMDPKVSPFF